MSEMLEIVKKTGLLICLYHFARKDYREKMLSALGLWIFVGSGMLYQVLSGTFTLGSFFLCASIGMGCLLISKLTAESLGKGDGLLFLGLGMFLKFDENLALLCGSLLLAGGFTGICLLLKKISKKDRIPFVPFVLTAYILFLI